MPSYTQLKKRATKLGLKLEKTYGTYFVSGIIDGGFQQPTFATLKQLDSFLMNLKEIERAEKEWKLQGEWSMYSSRRR